AGELLGVSAEGENDGTGRRVPDLHGLSALTEARRRPSSRNATPWTWRKCLSRVWRSWPVVTSQIFTPWRLAEARRRPSGLKATPSTGVRWPRRVWIDLPVVASQIFTVLYRRRCRIDWR